MSSLLPQVNKTSDGSKRRCRARQYHPRPSLSAPLARLGLAARSFLAHLAHTSARPSRSAFALAASASSVTRARSFPRSTALSRVNSAVFASSASRASAKRAVAASADSTPALLAS